MINIGFVCWLILRRSFRLNFLYNGFNGFLSHLLRYFLPLLLNYFVLQQKIYVIPQKIYIYYFVFVIVFLYFFHNIIFVDFIFCLYSHSNVLILSYYYDLHVLNIFCKRCWFVSNITKDTGFVFHLFIIFYWKGIFVSINPPQINEQENAFNKIIESKNEKRDT